MSLDRFRALSIIIVCALIVANLVPLIQICNFTDLIST